MVGFTVHVCMCYGFDNQCVVLVIRVSGSLIVKTKTVAETKGLLQSYLRKEREEGSTPLSHIVSYLVIFR